MTIYLCFYGCYQPFRQMGEVVRDVDVAIAWASQSTPEAQLAKMLPSERDYCLKTLRQITSSSNEHDVLGLLGAPALSRESGKIWHITLDGRMYRVCVAFRRDGRAARVSLRDGTGRCDYESRAKDHEQPAPDSPQQPATRSPET